MGPVRDDEYNRKSASQRFNNDASRHATPSPLPMEPPNFTPKSKHLSEHILQDFQFQYQQQQQHDPSPTDSHPRVHPRSHSRHRSTRSSETISAMFLIANERLSQETSRANEAERQAAEILAHFKIAQQTKQRLEIDFQRVKDELGLYKTQLNIAQAEIRRAQEIVNTVDRQRADAEDEARRGREKIRKLTESRAVELAMEEGRRLGYEEGVRQGRLMTHNEVNQPSRRYRRTSLRSARDDDDQVSYFSYTQEERHSAESSRSPSARSTSIRSVSRQRRMSDARTKPDNISIQPHPAKDSNLIRPISAQNHSPTMSHRSFKIPPDGYIPVAGANSVISLPPPHELSMPLPLVQPSATATNSDSKQARNKASTSRSSEHADREGRTRTPLSIGGASTSQHTLSRKRRMNGRPTPIDPKSEASTIISDLGLLGPPDDIGRNEDQDVDYFNQGMRSYSRPSFQTERVRGKSRCVNPDITPTPSRPVSPALDQYDESTSRMLGNFKIERPRSTDPLQRPQSRSTRRPREIVLPTPLPANFMNPGVLQKLDHAAQETADQWQNENRAMLSPAYPDTRQPFTDKSASNTSVPGIEIETPSSHTLSTPSGKTMVDPVLLTPESANRAIPLPASSRAQSTNEVSQNSSLGLHFSQPSGDEERITMTLPDNNFPPGFMPLSPIQGMKNLDSGFAPSGSSGNMHKLRDGYHQYPGGRPPSGFSYTSR